MTGRLFLLCLALLAIPLLPTNQRRLPWLVFGFCVTLGGLCLDFPHFKVLSLHAMLVVLLTEPIHKAIAWLRQRGR